MMKLHKTFAIPVKKLARRNANIDLKRFILNDKEAER